MIGDQPLLTFKGTGRIWSMELGMSINHRTEGGRARAILKAGAERHKLDGPVGLGLVQLLQGIYPHC